MHLKRELEPEVMDSPDEAAQYDAMDHREVNEAFIHRLIELGAHGRMLDIGAGPGQITILAGERIADSRIVGIDLSDSMLDIARRRLAESSAAGGVSFEVMNATDLAFEDHSFDVVFSNTILHHLPRPEQMVIEAWRVLKPGGVMLIRDLYRPVNEKRLDELVALHARDATPRQRELFHASLKAALTPDELKSMVQTISMPGVEVVTDTDRHVSIQTRSKG